MIIKNSIVKITIGLDIDRKSTRLNSSHLVISYAVFCLKKKKLVLPSLQPPVHQLAVGLGRLFAVFREYQVRHLHPAALLTTRTRAVVGFRGRCACDPHS